MLNPFFLIIDPFTYRGLIVLAIIVLAVLSLLSLMVMVVHKTMVEFRELLSSQLRLTHTDEVSGFLRGERSGLPVPNAGISFDALADAVITLLPGLADDEADRLRDELRRVGLVEHLRRTVETSRSWVRRYRAIERLGFLRFAELAPLYRKMLGDDSDNHLIPKALWALSFLAEPGDLDLLVATDRRHRLASAKFNEYVLTNMVASFRKTAGDDGAVGILRRFLEGSDNDGILKRALVEACGRCGFQGFAPVAVDIFFSSENDLAMKITALRAAGELHAPGLCGILGPSLVHEDWRLRLVAARYAHVCTDDALAHLEGLLQDRNYHVRLNAARSLHRLGLQGRQVLQAVAAAGTDRFARDISRYVLGGT